MVKNVMWRDSRARAICARTCTGVNSRSGRRPAGPDRRGHPALRKRPAACDPKRSEWKDQDVQGQNQGLSETAFSSPVASETGTIFIIVEYPPNYAAPAEGPALGVGYVREYADAGKQAANPYFVTGDGETWIGVSSRCRVLLDPILADRTSEAVVFSGPAKAKQDIPVQKLGLYAAPNPFNPQTTIALYLKGASAGDLKIYDVRGRLVTVLYTGPLVQGANSFTWNGRDSAGRGVASGAYWVQARTSDQSVTVKVLLLR